MSKMFKKPMNIFKIFWNGTKIYFKNLLPLSEAMLFPVFGQLGGILLILVPVYFYSQNVKTMAETFPFLNNIPLIFTILVLITLPGFFVFVKAFWDYMLQMVSLNLMVEDITNMKSLKSHKLYSQIIRLRSKDYIILLSILALIWLIGMLMPLGIYATGIDNALKPFLAVGIEFLAIFILMILTVYLSLAFQVFAYESSLSPINVLKRSLELVTNNFWRTVVLAIILFIITSYIIPSILQAFVENISLSIPLSIPFEAYLNSILPDPRICQQMLGPIAQLMNGDASNPIPTIAVNMALSTVGIVTTALMLPYGTACYAILYMDIIKKREIAAKKNKKK